MRLFNWPSIFLFCFILCNPSKNEQLFHNKSEGFTEDYEKYSSDNSIYYNLIQLEDAWKITSGRDDVNVGIIDTGIYLLHSYLSGNVTLSKGSYLSPNYTTQFGDSVGHGTFVAGIIGAKTNSTVTVSGVCQNVGMVSYRYFTPDPDHPTSSVFTWPNICNAISSVNNQNVPIINFSGGGYSNYYEPPLTISPVQSAISSYSGLFVCSAGNLGQNNDSTPHYPSSYPLDNIIVVGASTTSDDRWSSSNYGNNSVDLFAPGNNVYSTTNIGGYENNSGTSFATAFVSGTAALIKSVNPSLTALQIKNIILNNVDTSPSFLNKCTSGGRLNVYNSVKAAIPSISSGINLSIQDLPAGGQQFYKIYCSPGVYTFESTGNLDLSCYLYNNPLNNYFVSSSTGGTGSNFSLTYYIPYSGVFYLKIVNDGSTSGSYKILINHTHSYTNYYEYYNMSYHKAYCDCGESVLKNHVVGSDGRCNYCGAQLLLYKNLFSDGTTVSNKISVYNDSYLLEPYNVILLGPYDLALLQEKKIIL